MMKVCLLGASGSIGGQTIDVMLKNKEDFDLVGFSVGLRTAFVSKILKKYPNVKHICVRNKEDMDSLKKKYPEVNFYYGDSGLISLIENCNADMVVNALVGFVGLAPTIKVLEMNKICCLANKESLVVGGEIINNLLKQGKGTLYPIDSEHVALAKCLEVDNKNVDKIIITASGGAFRNLTRRQLTYVTPEHALKHPTCNMGKKITIDSASMVNKTFEVIEAHYLFGYSFKNIGIILNYNSYVHSLVLYRNGEYRLDCGKPDMRVPIKYALYQGLTPYKTVVTKDLGSIKGTEFGVFDIKRYPAVKFARTVIRNKGTYGAVLNAANEVAVSAFLDHKIRFTMIEKIISLMMKMHQSISHPTYEDIVKVDRQTRETVNYLIKEGGIK